MDKEFFDCDEYKKSEEFQRFPAEDFRVNEAAKGAVETYSAPETSLSENPSAISDDPGISLSDAEEFAQSASASSASSSASASASSSASATASASASASVSISASASVATGVVAGIAAVCVAVTVGIVPVEGITQDEPPAYQIEEPAEEPIDFGTLNFVNYRVDYYFNEDSFAVLSDITFYFEGALAEGFTCELSDVLTGESVVLSDDTVTFERVERGDREFLLTIYGGDEIVETQTVNVEDHYISDEYPEVYYAYKVTYNSDNTSNIYAYFTTEYEGDFVTYINIHDEFGDVIDGYETVTGGALSSVSGISEEIYNVAFVTYYVKDNNYYSFCASEKTWIGDDSFGWAADASDNLLTLSFGNEVRGPVSVTVTHDDFSRETFDFSSSDFVDNTYEITLSRVSHNLTVEVYASAVLYNYDPSGYISEFEGVEYRTVYDSANIAAFVSSSVRLTRCEIYDFSYNSGSDDKIHAPVYLYFDGFLNEGDTYSVKVTDMDGTEAASATGLTLSDKPVIFVDLLSDTDYTFTYFLTANGQETQAGEITRTLSILEFPDLPPLFCLNPNPGDTLITYNEDGTSNVYLYMNVQETEYDLYYKVYLVDVAYSDGSVFFEYAGKENVAVLRNIPAGRYSIKYAVLINDGETCYSVYSQGYPSGVIVTGLDEDGYYPGSGGGTSYDSATGELFVSVSGKVVGDLRVTVISDDGVPHEFTVSLADIAVGSSSTCTLDLSAYGLTSFTATIEGEAIFQYGNGDAIKAEETVTGDESCPFRIESAY